jgi:hypothetical protein
MADQNTESPLQWETIDLSKLYPEFIDQVADAIQVFSQILTSLLELIKDALEFARAFIAYGFDVFELAFTALYDLIFSLIQQLTQTGVYTLYHYTPSFSMYMTPSQWCQDVANSLNDRMDPERPILVDPSAFVCMVCVMTTADNLKELLTTWKSFCAYLGSFAASFFGQLDNWPNPGDPFAIVPGVGNTPNWHAGRLCDVIPFMKQASDFLVGLLDSMRPTNLGLTDTIIDQIIAFIEDKLLVMEKWGTKILGIMAIINAILSIEGMYYLTILGGGPDGASDAQSIGNRLISATGGPHDFGKFEDDGVTELPEELKKVATYSLGITFLAAGGTTGPKDLLYNLFRTGPPSVPNPDWSPDPLLPKPKP